MKHWPLLFGLAVALTGCERKKAAAPPPLPAPVRVAVVAQQTVPVQVRAIGAVEPLATVAVKAQVTGPLLKVHFAEGQDVKQGDVLFTIDPRPFEATLMSVAALAMKTKADLERVRQLFGQRTVSQQELDAAVAASQAAAAALERARLDVEYCTIKAPMDGRTGAWQVDAGNIIKANDNPLVTLNQLAPIYVTFTVPERHLADIRQFMAAGPLRVRVDGVEGAVSFVDNAVDQTTGMVRLKATFPNADRRLWPGQFVEVTLTLTEQANVVTVPAEAVQVGQAGQYVVVVKADRSAESRPVKVGRSFNGETVVEQGLQPGETVVTDGHLRVAPGGKVDIKQ
jgi:multidrug efflux system membrane fusion protein